jgi:ABC-type sulfate transport system permease component
MLSVFLSLRQFRARRKGQYQLFLHVHYESLPVLAALIFVSFPMVIGKVSPTLKGSSLMAGEVLECLDIALIMIAV